MKRLIICFSVLAFIPVLLMGQKVVNERDVPERIIKDFNKKAPEAINPKWEQFDSTTYQVTYMANDTKTSIKFLNVSTETRWYVDAKWTPKTIQHYIDSAYTKAKVISLCIADIKGQKTYEANIKQKKNSYLLTFETNGRFIEAVDLNPKKKK